MSAGTSAVVVRPVHPGNDGVDHGIVSVGRGEHARSEGQERVHRHRNRRRHSESTDLAAGHPDVRMPPLSPGTAERDNYSSNGAYSGKTWLNLRGGTETRLDSPVAGKAKVIAR